MSEWKEVQLGSVLEIKYGKDHKQLGEGVIPCLGSGGLMRYVDRYIYDEESILIPRKGTLNNIMYQNSPFWTVDTMFWSKIDKSSVFPKFLFYQLTTVDYSILNVGSAVPSLTVPVINEITISLPSLLEQRAIASILSSLDNKIDLLRRQNTTLEGMAETLFRQWFVVEAKEEWEEVELGEVIETTSGGTPSRSNMGFYKGGSINWVKSKELNGTFILDTEEKISEEALKKSSAKILPKNSVLIAMYGATVGEYGIITKEMTCNQAVCALKPNENYPYTYLFQLVKFNKDELINMAVGSAQQNISQLLIKKIPVLNCIERIKEFHSVVNPSFEKIKSNHNQIYTLTALRDTLLPKLMNGEVRVEE
ncbi:MAG TPA: restriction endonuclease subunit S [Prolixibacteraceae bacterium]